jgi:predicted aspartyl protease
MRIQFVILGTLLFGCALAQDKAPESAALQLSPYGLLFTKVSLNGREMLAMVDTGFSAPVALSSKMAAELKLALEDVPGAVMRDINGRSKNIQKARVATFQLGGLERKNLTVHVIGTQIEDTAKQVGTDYDVILGWGFFANRKTSIDYSNLKMLFNPPASDEKPWLVLNYDSSTGVPTVRGSIDGREIALLFDTGNPAVAIDTGLAEATAKFPLKLGETAVELNWYARDLSVIKAGNHCEGVLGTNFFAKHRLLIDSSEKKIYIF